MPRYRPLTPLRRQILLNLQQGKDPFAGFEGPRYGGALRSVQTWRDFWKLVAERDRTTGDNAERLKLTPLGEFLLEESHD